MSNREARKERIRKIIQEACGGPEMRIENPCPIETARKLRDSGHSAEQVMSWVSELIESFNSGQLPMPMAQPVTTMVAMEQNSKSGRTIDTMTQAKNRGGIVGGIGFKK